jgi:hypothetical protein
VLMIPERLTSGIPTRMYETSAAEFMYVTMLCKVPDYKKCRSACFTSNSDLSGFIQDIPGPYDFFEATRITATRSNSLHDDRKPGETLMRKAMLLTAVLTVCAGLALAQDTPSNSTSGQNDTTTTTTTTTDQSTSANTIQGCLMGTTGNYMLTDAAGISYKVQGDESQLSSNVNKEVEVTGTVASTASASASNNADTNAPNSSSASAQPNQGGNPNASGAGGSSTGATATATASKTLNASSVKTVADSCSGK